MSKPSIEELLAEIERTEDRATYAVLADALVERGDPRGELMQVQLALDDAAPDDKALVVSWPRMYDHRSEEDFERDGRTPRLDRAAAKELRIRETALREARTTALLGVLPKYHGVELGFRFGLLDRVAIGFTTLPASPTADAAAPSIGGILTRIFASPEARMLRIVEIAPKVARTDLLAYLASSPTHVPSLRSFVCGRAFMMDGAQFSPGEDPPVDLSRVFDAFPQLPELWVGLGVAEINWPALVSPHLRHLTYMTPAVLVDELEHFSRAELPALESFTLWTGASHFVNEKDDYVEGSAGRRIELHQLAPVFAMLDCCPALRRVGICNYADDVTELVAALAAHPHAASLSTLDLSRADAVNGATLAAELVKLPALRELVVEGVKVTSADNRTLRGDNRTLHGGYPYDDGRYRYVVHQE